MVIEFNYNPELFWAKVDKSGECWLWTASTFGHGYGQFVAKCEGRKVHIGAHRIAYQEAHGPIPDGLFVDHICHTKLCVNPAHLRPVTNKQNGENRQGNPSGNTSGVCGVSWADRQKSWVVKVRHNHRQIHGGYFKSFDGAASKAVEMRNELFTHNNADRQAV